MLGSSDPISPAEIHTHTQSYTYTESHSPQVHKCLVSLAWALTQTCVAGAGGPLRRHAVPLQVCVCDRQQVVAAGGTAQARLGVQQAARVATWEGHAHVVVGGGQTLLGRDGRLVNITDDK